jgi:hypothetical protein
VGVGSGVQVAIGVKVEFGRRVWYAVGVAQGVCASTGAACRAIIKLEI